MAKLRHDCCGGKNCYLEKYHADIADFDEDLPGRCEYTDIDAFVESGRHYLFTEFKTAIGEKLEAHWAPQPWKRQNGQMLALERLTEDLPKSTVWLVEGDAPNRKCKRMRELVDGAWSDWVNLDWSDLKQLHRDWLRNSTIRFQGRLAAA